MFKTLCTTGLLPRCEPQEFVRFVGLLGFVSNIVGIAFRLEPKRSDLENGLNRLTIESLRPPDPDERSDCFSFDSRRFETSLSRSIRSELDLGTLPPVTSDISEDPSGMPRRSRT